MKKKSKREFAARVLIHNQSEYDFVAFVLIKKESRRELMTLMLKRNQPVEDCPKLCLQATAKAATHVAPHYYRNVQTVIQTV